MRHHSTRRRSPLFRRLCLVAASFVLGIAGWFLLGESESLTASEGPAQPVLARIDGTAVTEDEVLALASEELRELERRRREVMSRTAREAVQRRLIAAEAARRGVSPEELLAAEGADSPAAFEELVARLERGHTVEYLTEPAGAPRTERSGG